MGFVSSNLREQWKNHTLLLFASSKELQGSDMENRKIRGGDRKCDSFVDLWSASVNILSFVVSNSCAGEVAVCS